MRGIHRYWSGPPPSSEPWTGATLRSLGHKVTDWNDENLPPSVVTWLDSLADNVLSGYEMNHRANLVRLWILSEHGGAWLDHDVILLRPLTEPAPFVAGHWDPCNCVMCFDEAHPVLGLMMDAADSYDGPPTTASEASGEKLLWRMITPDVEVRQLPFGPTGLVVRGAEPWAVHLYSGANKRRRNATDAHTPKG